MTHLLVTQIAPGHDGSRSHALVSAVLRQGFQACQNSAQNIGSVAAAGANLEQAGSPQNQARQLLLVSAGALTLHARHTPNQRKHRENVGTALEHLQMILVAAESVECRAAGAWHVVQTQFLITLPHLPWHSRNIQLGSICHQTAPLAASVAPPLA